MKFWELIDFPQRRNDIKCKWILKKNLKSDWTLERCKARLVAKDYTQKHGIEYVNTSFPMAKFISIRILMALIAKLDLELFQMDVCWHE